MRVAGKTSATLAALLLLAVSFSAYWLIRQARGREHHRAALDAIERRDFRQARDHLQDCLSIWPRDASLHLLAAQAARRDGDAEGAFAELRVFQDLGGADGRRDQELQLLAMADGDLRDADKLLQSYTSDLPPADAYWFLEAYIPAVIRRVESAREAKVSVLVGPVQEEFQKAQRALKRWRQLSKNRADQVQALIWSGQLANLLDNQRQAEIAFAEALDLEPDHIEVRLKLAETLAVYEPQKAMRHLETLRRRQPQREQIELPLAYLYRNAGRPQDAQRILDEFLAAHPDHPAALLERGKAALDAAEPEQAERYLRRCLSLSPDDPFVHLALSQCLRLLGNDEEARKHQQRHAEISVAIFEVNKGRLNRLEPPKKPE